MRFPADVIHRVRRGEVTATLRRWHRRPTGFRIGTRHAIEKVDDVRIELDDGAVVYDREVTRLGDSIEITAAYSQLDPDGRGVCEPQLRALRAEGRAVPDARPAILDELPEPIVAAAGFEELADLVDFFRAELGGPAYQRIWVFEFTLVAERPRFMAHQDGLTHPPQYTTNPARAIDDAEVLDEVTLADFTKRAARRHAKHRRVEAQERLDACQTPEERLRVLRALARDAGVDVRSDIRALERRILDKLGRAA